MQDKKPDAPVSDDSNLVIVATPEYVKEKIEEHAKSRNHPYATHVEPGFVTLSNETDSDSDLTAATSKAVKKAYDLASTANQNALNNNSDLYLEKRKNGEDIPDKKAFVDNLGLSESVYRTIGNGPNQIPDMSFFTSGSNWFKMPDGRIIQYGRANFSRDNPGFFYADVQFPIPFTGMPQCVFATLYGLAYQASYLPNVAIDMIDNKKMTIPMFRQGIPDIPESQVVMWLAIGY
ncbi:phage tail protein [Xenorhabdus santafensis]|uniref:phage tail protein n=1 Tax=Xenorhabdus santafensis TaxID=2582833 RepID=UPI0029E7F37E|nr:phage tail protein [Xenorhabdus sp. 12]